MYWSDDPGARWAVGEPLGDEYNKCAHGLLPRSNSSIIMNFRTGGGKRSCGIYFDSDLNLQGDVVYLGLEDPGRMGSIE